MPATLTIKKAPETLLLKLKEMAKEHHRSLQGEVLTILEQAAEESDMPRGVEAVAARVRQIGLKTMKGSSVRMIREDRDSR
jgi:plasmid stability protein